MGQEKPTTVVIAPPDYDYKRYEAPDPNACTPNLRARMQTSGPQIYWAHVHKTALGGAKADILVPLGFPCNAFALVNALNALGQNSIFFHLRPLNKTYTGNGTNAIGTEEWIPLTNFPSGSTQPLWGILRFREKITQFYLDIGQEAGGGDFDITIACFNDDTVMFVGGQFT